MAVAAAPVPSGPFGLRHANAIGGRSPPRAIPRSTVERPSARAANQGVGRDAMMNQLMEMVTDHDTVCCYLTSVSRTLEG